jgi:hypothetical protein
MSEHSPHWLPAADYDHAPHTGYTRAHWEAAADRILAAAWRHSDAQGAMVDFAGTGSPPMARLEGFARTFMLAALRIVGDPEGSAPLVQRYAEAICHAVRSGVWPRLGDHSQATVEAASVAVGLHLTRDTLWPALDERTRTGVLEWFEQARGTWCADNNHVLLGAALAAFAHSTGFSDGRDIVENALERMDDWYRGEGWYTDGDGRRFDHYNAYAFHWYPFFIDEMMGAGFDDRRAVHRERLGAFLDGYQHFFDRRGAPVLQGRSLIYRWAVTAPFWMAAREGVDALPASRIRRLGSGVLKNFIDGGSLDSGVLSLGWQRAPMPSIVQSYSGVGSPYWVAKGFLGLALPASHPLWQASETPLEIEQRDVRRVLAGPRWLLDGRQADGVVRLHNLGSDGHPTHDDPLYRRLLFTSATRPVAQGVVRDNDLTIEGALHRPATQATVGVRGGSVTRALDAGGRHVSSQVSMKVLADGTLHVARLRGCVGLTARVSGSAVVADETPADAVVEACLVAVTGQRVLPVAEAALRSTVEVLGAFNATPASPATALAVLCEGVLDEVVDGEDVLQCPAVRLPHLPAEVILVWRSDLRAASASVPEPVLLRDVEVHDDHMVLSLGGERLVFRWSLSEPFPADAQAQLIRRL